MDDVGRLLSRPALLLQARLQQATLAPVGWAALLRHSIEHSLTITSCRRWEKLLPSRTLGLCTRLLRFQGTWLLDALLRVPETPKATTGTTTTTTTGTVTMAAHLPQEQAGTAWPERWRWR